MSAYGKARLLHKIDSIMRQIENSDVILDTTFFNSVISVYGHVGDVKKMNEMFLAMKDKDCEPDSITFATMIHAYKTMGMIEAAQDLEKKIIKAEYNLGTSKLHVKICSYLLLCCEIIDMLCLCLDSGTRLIEG